jgi:hypothetical protein
MQLGQATSFPAGRDALDGHVTSWNSQQHVNYVDAQGHIHELYYLD